MTVRVLTLRFVQASAIMDNVQLGELFASARQTLPPLILILQNEDHFHGGPLPATDLVADLTAVLTKLGSLSTTTPGRETYHATMYLAYALVRPAFALSNLLEFLINSEYEEDGPHGEVLTLCALACSLSNRAPKMQANDCWL
jgi:hypothetical protein